MGIRDKTSPMDPRVASPPAIPAEYELHGRFMCECGGTVDTKKSKLCDRTTDGTCRYRGTPCDSCERTYTVEVYRTPEEGAAEGSAP